MKIKLIIFLISLIALFSCRAKKDVLSSVSEVKETLVPYRLPADSAWLFAWLECDSTNKVRIKELTEHNTKGLSTNFNFADGKLSYKATKLDTVIYVKEIMYVHNIETIRTIMSVQKVPVEVYRQTNWQIVTSWFGKLTLIFLALFGAWKFIKWKFFKH